MKLIETELKDLFIVEAKVFDDPRGYFYEAFNKQAFEADGLVMDIKQTNISKSQGGVVRGLHFQNPPFSQGKLIRVLKGAVLDVVVDIRKNSMTYGKHFSIELSEENKKALWVPPGFAHGFKTLMDDTIFYYDCTEEYNRDSEGSILWNDAELGIDWGIQNPILSEKDSLAPRFSELNSQF
ncbi:MAG: dTDP-4-dehydrorhamnose 3,5-epimerase [Flavobacteriales bacterium]|nr:dTDP-4-dehydrorhamnose 3,5-epimerase [Flavobacteriales bacterium]